MILNKSGSDARRLEYSTSPRMASSPSSSSSSSRIYDAAASVGLVDALAVTWNDKDERRSERRGLLPLQRNEPLSTTTASAANNEDNNMNSATARTNPRRPSRGISLRRKLHDRRLRKILNDTDDVDEQFLTRRRSPHDWMRPYWLGLGLFLILFPFWILDSLKDPVFGALVGGRLQQHLPTAKMLSVGTTLALVCLMEYIAQERQKSASKTRRDRTRDSNRDTDLAVAPEDILSERGGPWKPMNITTTKLSSSSYSFEFIRDHNDRSYEQEFEESDHVPSNMFATMCVPFCIIFALMAYLLQFNPSTAWVAGRDMVPSTFNTDTQSGRHDHQATAWKVLGYALYAAIESFGSLAVATFWSYTNSTLALHDAEAYYGTIIAFAQMGAIAGSTLVTLHLWSSITLFIVACLVILLHVIVMMLYSRRFPPTSDVAAASDEPVFVPPGTTKVTAEPTVWSGVHLILKHNYVLLILGVSCLYEVSLTCLNYQMTLLGWSRFEETPSFLVGNAEPNSSDGATFDIMNMSFTQFMGHYGQMVNVSSLVLSLFIFPLLIQNTGVKYTLRVFPTLLLLVNIIAFGALPGNLAVLFFSISLLKAMTYSIHDPVKEILYIPTSNAIKFKAKFWIDVVGARFAKAIGSSINHYSGSVHRSIRIASAPSLLTAAALWWVCYRVGLQFDELVQGGTIVGLDEDPVCMDQVEYSGDNEEDEDTRGAVLETNESIQLTAL